MGRQGTGKGCWVFVSLFAVVSVECICGAWRRFACLGGESLSVAGEDVDRFEI